LNTYLTDPRALAGGTTRSTWCHFDKPRTDATYPRIQIEQLPGTNDIISLGTNYSELTYCYYNIHFYTMKDFKLTTRLNGVRVSVQDETLVSHYFKEIKNALKEHQSITQALYIDGFKMLGTSKIIFDPDTKLYHGFITVRYFYFTQAI